VARRDRAARVRELAVVVGERAGVSVEASFDGAAWSFDWSNGPVSLRSLVEDEAPRLGLDPAAIRLQRLVQDDAMPVQAVRLGRAGQFSMWMEPVAIDWAITVAAQSTDYPDRPADEREAALAARLVAEVAGVAEWVDAGTIAQVISERGGIGWLYAPEAGKPPGGPEDALALLTSIYASGQSLMDWKERGALLDAVAALAAVQDDPSPSGPAVCAGLTVLRAQRAELERAELGLLDAARAVDVTWEDLARAIGAGTRQAAYKRHRDLTHRHMTAKEPSSAAREPARG